MTFVFLSHLNLGFSGDFGVTVFFFLSGYLIARMLLEERDRTGRISWGRFAARRVLRLYPALLATLLLAWGLMLIGIAIGYSSLLGFLSQAIFFHNYYVIAADMQPAIPFGTSVLWSLAVEAHFYLLFPILVLLTRSDARLTWAIVALLVAAPIWRFVRVAYFGADDWAIYISTDTRVDSILWGCLLTIAERRDLLRRVFPSWMLGPWLVVASAVLASSFALQSYRAFELTLMFSLQGAALAPLFYYAINHSKAHVFGLLNYGPIIRLGQLSYTIYLVHHFVIYVLAVQLRVPLDALYLLGLPAAFLSVIWALLIERTLPSWSERSATR